MLSRVWILIYGVLAPHLTQNSALIEILRFHLHYKECAQETDRPFGGVCNGGIRRGCFDSRPGDALLPVPILNTGVCDTV